MTVDRGTIRASLIVDAKATLGESACWAAVSGTVHWIDQTVPALHRFEHGSRQHAVIPLAIEPVVGMIAATTSVDVFAVAHARGIGLLDLNDHRLTPLADPEFRRQDIAYNDAKVDPLGRLWVGTCDARETEPRGCLWLLENNCRPRLIETGMAVVNGPAFTPDGRTMYVCDSAAGRIMAYDIEGSAAHSRRIFAEMTVAEGLPDGVTVDSEACLWCAHWDGGRVTRFSPAGKRLLTVPIPAPRVTSVAFGGPGLATLFVTTARQGLSADALEQFPASGGLFAIETGICGIAATPLPLPFRCA